MREIASFFVYGIIENCSGNLKGIELRNCVLIVWRILLKFKPHFDLGSLAKIFGWLGL